MHNSISLLFNNIQPKICFSVHPSLQTEIVWSSRRARIHRTSTYKTKDSNHGHRRTNPRQPSELSAFYRTRFTGRQASLFLEPHTQGLCQHNSQSFYLLDDENSEKFAELRARLAAEYQPETETERILVQRMADHEWLRMRALRLQHSCIFEDQHVLATEQFALYLRYQTTHERAFYKALKELQTIRAQRTKDQIGFESFESQKLERAAEQRAAEAHNPKKQGFELKKEQFELKKKRLASSKRPEKDTGHATAPTSAGGIPVRPHVPAV